MSKILTPAQEFDDPSEALAHYGVKGMKWGVRNEDKPRAKLSAPAGASTATKRVVADYNKMSDKEFLAKHAVSRSRYAKRVLKKGDPAREAVSSNKPTSEDIKSARARVQSQVRQINNQIDKTNLATGKQLTKEADKLHDMSMSYLKNPDRATASRLTRGEKFALGLLAVGVPGAGTAVAGGYAGQMRLQRAAIERQQRKLSS